MLLESRKIENGSFDRGHGAVVAGVMSSLSGTSADRV